MHVIYFKKISVMCEISDLHSSVVEDASKLG